jgi:chitodextrinase
MAQNAAAAGPPRVVTTAPRDGATVQGMVTWKASVASPPSRQARRRYGARPRRVEFRVDGALQRVDRVRPYQYTWDTRAETNGRHTLVVRAVWRTSSSRTRLARDLSAVSPRTLMSRSVTTDSTRVKVLNKGRTRDREAPTAPATIDVTLNSGSAIAIAWQASTDNVGVAGYGVYFDGALMTKTGATSFSYSGLSCSAVYTLGVDAYDKAGNRSAVRSVSGSTAACSPPVETVAPSISGIAREAQTLTASEGSWTGKPTGYAYRWLRCDSTGAACGEIPTATEGAYVVTTGDVGETLRVRVTASNAAGSTSATSTQTPAVAAPTSTSAWPASYFTGPLGASNILPAARDGALVGLFHSVPRGTVQEQRDAIVARENAAGRRFDVYTIFLGGAGTFNGIPNCAYASGPDTAQWVDDRGGVPLISWTPKRSTSSSLLRDINEGRKDACLRAVADRLGQLGFRIMLRPLHEFDQGIYGKNADGTCDYPDCGEGQPFIDAWRRIVGIFHGESRAPNVGFYWCPIEGFDRDYQDKSYPGDAYVDWVGADRYNRGTGWPSPLHSGWADFWEMFNYPKLLSGATSLYSRYASRKPYFVGETSSKYDAPNPNRKGTWYRNIAKAKDPTDAARYMPNLIGVNVFDAYVSNEDNDWRVDRAQTATSSGEGALSPESYAGWKDWVRDPRWNVGVAGGAN